MSHSVERHLSVSVEAYDTEIRRFVPGYERMLDEVADVVARVGATHVLDLGAGTGGLSERLAQRLPVRLSLLDADASMLARAEQRLASYRDRITLSHGSFADALPACDVAVAALSLHHVHAPRAKVEVYRNVHSVAHTLVTADAMLPRDRGLAAHVWAAWTAHLVSGGDTEAQAQARFDEWATEDRYFSIEEEISMMREGGFSSAEVTWRAGPIAVVVAQR